VTTSLAPSLLLSMPQMLDPNFARTVVLLCQHNDNGALGLVMNRPLATTGRVVVNVEPTVSKECELEVWVGGPVEPERSWILVGNATGEDPEVKGMRIADNLYLSTSPALLQRLLGPTPPPDTRLVAGYSGWAPGQLEAEFRASAWLIGDTDRDLIFNTPPNQMWETAIRRLGADPAMLQRSCGIH